MIANTLSQLSCSEKMFSKAAPEYKQDLRNSGFSENINYLDPIHDPEKHNPEWTQFRMDTIPNVHDPEWTRSRMDTIPNGHDPE